MDGELRQSVERIQEIVRNHKGIAYPDVLAERLDAVVGIIESQAAIIAELTRERDELQLRLATEVTDWEARADRLTAENERMARERDDLRAVVERLPKTRDGVRIIPGEEIVYRLIHVGRGVPKEPSGHFDTARHLIESGYSTREAALAAREGEVSE